MSRAVPSPASRVGVGQSLDGKYRLERLLGEGGMALVFEATHQKLGNRVAVKVLAPEFARDAELVERFEREARAVAQLETRHVARVIDVDTSMRGEPYIVMEFLEGRDLEAELAARGALPASEVVDYVLQACSAVAQAHDCGIIHRDLKPANLFLADEKDGRVVKVLDFGISKVLGEATKLTAASAVMGTVLYMSPEQVRASSNVDARADVWSLGVILYELLAGNPPWAGSPHQIASAIVSEDAPPLEARVTVPPTLALTVRRMLQRDPARRFPSVRDVMAALAPLAPAASLGGRAAAAVLAAQGPTRGGTAMMAPQRTMPLAKRPPGVPPSHPDAVGAIAPTPPSGQSAARAALDEPASRESRTRTARSSPVLALAVVLGLLGAFGVVLIAVAVHRTRARTPPAEPVRAPTTATTAPR